MKVAALLLLCAIFGLSSAAIRPSGRVIGGHNAGDGQFPYMVSLRSGTNSHFCGGFIHNARWVVSAAHCTAGRTTANTFAQVGSHRLSTGGIQHNIEIISNHPNFNANNFANDISLLRTVQVIMMSPTVQTIPLNTGDTPTGIVAVVSGWGLTANPGYHPDVLQWLSKPIVSMSSCRLSHHISDRSRIDSTHICTDNHDGIGTCTGDNGGPLVAGSSVIGIFSWTIPCATGVSDVYTRISSHVAWINNVATV